MRMIAAICLLMLGERGARAEREPSVWEAELRLGYGVSMTGGDGMTTTSTTPLDVSAILAIAIRDQPRVYAFGGITAEALDRTGVGVVAGVRLVPLAGAMRLAAGGTWIAAPATLWGAMGSAGVCHRGDLGLCLDAQLTSYFAGTAIGPDQTITQVQLVAGLVFDAL
jgi:hypothetical protein